MRADLAESIQREAQGLIQSVGERRVVVWGAGEVGSWLMKQLGHGGVAFVDANPTKHGTSISGRPVHPIADLDSLEWDEVWIAVLSDVQAIADELTANGLVEGQDFRRPFPNGKWRQVLDELERTRAFLRQFDLAGRHALEVGFGGQLFLALNLLHLGVERVYVTDVSAQARALEGRRGEWLAYLQELDRRFGPARMDSEALLERIQIHPAGVSADQLPFAEDAFDLIVNTGVMEHVENAEGAIAEFQRVLRPDGMALCCAIGIHDHRANDPNSGFTPWSFLTHSDDEWSSLGSNAYHQNRWRAVDFERAFERHGFRILRREAVADGRLDGQQVKGFNERFREQYTLEELAELDLFLGAQL